MMIGLYVQELIRHVDPSHRTLGRFFHDEMAKPLNLEFYIGLPPEIPDTRLPISKWTVVDTPIAGFEANQIFCMISDSSLAVRHSFVFGSDRAGSRWC